ncbi:hypothetical protein Q3G72_013442 [Acer saccharum]|nr:hypothetical protein Q3G72_013442 [Acer saccharum]
MADVYLMLNSYSTDLSQPCEPACFWKNTSGLECSANENSITELRRSPEIDPTRSRSRQRHLFYSWTSTVERPRKKPPSEEEDLEPLRYLVFPVSLLLIGLSMAGFGIAFDRPLFPGFYMPLYVKDPELLAALQENRKRQAPYCGAFLLKDEPGSDTSATEIEKSVLVASLILQVSKETRSSLHRPLRITEMVSEDPLTVKVDHLKDNPYDKDDDVIKATSFEHIGDFSFPRLADFGASISGGNKVQCQAVLEELDVYKCLKLSLELVKKEMEISKIQESIAKGIEEKITGEQRCYLLNDQLKAIKKLLEASYSEFDVNRNYLDWLTARPALGKLQVF